MLKLYIILAWRNLLKRKVYSLIQVLGLTVGITCFMITLLYVKKELSYDQFFEDSNAIYRILNLEPVSGDRYSGGPSALGVHIRNEISQVKKVVRVFFPCKMFSTSWLVAQGEHRFYEENIAEADTNFFSLFNFTFVSGNPKTALKDPDAVVLSTHAARKYFGNESPIGKFISINQDQTLLVSAVVAVPENTHLYFDFMRSLYHNPAQDYVWDHTLAFTYVKVDDEIVIPSVEKQLYDIIIRNYLDNDAEYLKNYRHQLQPLRDVHTTVIQWDITKAVSARQLWSVGAIAAFILILAIVNFVNLATARASERMKEAGINKILGASKHRLILSFFAEVLIMTSAAGILALTMIMACMPLFNELMETSRMEEFFHPSMISAFVVVILITTLFSGLYPAYRIAAFEPVKVMKKITGATDQQSLRQILVSFQFIIAIGLLSGTLIIQRQIEFMQEANLGFNKDRILILRLRGGDRTMFDKMKNQLQPHAFIQKIAGASALLGGETGSDTFHPDHMPGQTTESFAKNTAVDYDFLDLIGVPIVDGRNFEYDNPHDFRHSFIINETAVKQFQLKDPIGVNFIRSGETQGRVIGVMKDFHFSKMTDRINPLVFYLDSLYSFRYMFLKLNGNIPQAVQTIEGIWNKVIPEYPIEYFFQDQYFNQQYKQEQQVAKITQLFSVIAIVLSCVGLLGMSSFIILQRTKEIGIRKIIGASLADILKLLSFTFIKTIAIAFIISVPITILIMNQWLEDFINKIDLSPYFFIASGTLTMGVSILTISIQVIRAALANPVDAIKQE